MFKLSSVRGLSVILGVIAIGLVGFVDFFATSRLMAQQAPEPVLRIDTGGHSSYVTSLIWSPSEDELHSAGWDKLVRVWRPAEGGLFENVPQRAIRLPIGPGPSGKLDTLAISSSGRWLAIGGYASLATRAASFRDNGVELPLSDVELLEQGIIYVFDQQQNRLQRLEGHRGPVRQLLFARGRDGSEQLLSAGFDRNAKRETVGSLRAWDVANGRQLAGVLLPEAPQHRPTLAAFVSPNSAGGLQVLAALGAGKIYQWDTSIAPQLRTHGDGIFNSIVAAPTGQRWVLTASGDNQSNAGQVQFWNIDAAGLPVRDARKRLQFASQGNEIFLPLSVALMSSRPGLEADRLAVALCVLQLNAGGAPRADRFELRVLTLPDGAGNTRELSRQPLWKVAGGEIRVPAMSTSPTGKFLAVAGNPNHEIQIFQVDQLLQGPAQSEHLQGTAVALSRVEFVERQGQLGLRFQEVAEVSDTAPVQSVFDFGRNAIERADVSSWESRGPDARGLVANRSNTNANEIELRQAGALQHKVQVPERHVLSSFVLTGPVGVSQKPLLVVAAYFEGQPWLGVVDTNDGRTKRILTAHTEPITSMAVSADSQLLATTSFDQTLAVWNLTDVDRLLKPRGALPGVALVTKDQAVEVNAIQAGGKVDGDFKPGDQLLGYLDGNGTDALRPWSSSEEVILALWEREAGSEIAIRRSRSGAITDVKVSLQQAVDERKPLFQMMIARGGDQPHQSWIGWSPLGPFDASDREIREHLGWHFNVRRPERPVDFAPLDQYPDLYQPGLLDKLVSQVGKAVAVVPLAFLEPQMSFAVVNTQNEQWDAAGTAILREAPRALTVRINNEEFLHGQVQALQLRINGKLAGAFSPAEPGSWQFDATQAEGFSRGPQLLRAELSTNSNPTRTIVVEQPIHFIPPPPHISFMQPIAGETKEASLSVAAKIDAGSLGEGYEAAIHRLKDDGQRETLHTWSTKPGDAPLVIEYPVELMEGINQFELIARNAGATADTEASEMSLLKIETVRRLRDNSPPTIHVTSIESNSGRAPYLLTSDTGAAWLSESDQISIRGSVQAVENLVQAMGQGEPLSEFVPGSSNRFEFNWQVRLQPGINRIRLSSKTDTSLLATAELEVLFREPLPDIELASPAPEQVISEHLSEQAMEIRAVFQVDAQRSPVKAQALVNGRPVDQVLNVNMGQGVLHGTIPLSLGTNRLQFKLSNDTGAETLSRPFTIHYQPQPIVELRQVPKEIEQSAYDVHLSGSSITPLKRILLDSRELPDEVWDSEHDGAKFKLHIRHLAWQADQRQSVLALFADGIDQPTFETIDVPTLKRVASPPQLAFVSPVDTSSVATENLTIEFVVSSRTELTSVELTQGGERLAIPAIERTPTDSAFKLRRSVDVQMKPGPNTFQLTAENPDGLRSRTLSVNYVPSPVALRLGDLTTAADPTIKYPLARSTDGLWRLEAPLGTARCVLTGSVHWSYADHASLNDSRLKVWVAANGLKQAVTLAPAAANSLVREFSCPIQLIRARGNSLDVSVPDLPELASSLAKAEVDCKSPELMRQRLHLAIVGVGVDRSEEQQLMQEAVASLSGSQLQHLANRKEFSFQSPAFAECIGYGPYVGPVVSREKIGSLLEMIRIRIQQANAREAANDVMLLYYRGGEQVNSGGQFYLTTQQSQTERQGEIIRDPLQLKYFAVSSETISYFVDRCPGTQLLLLDVARNRVAQESASNEPELIPGAVTFRYAWLKGTPVPANARLLSEWQAAPKPLRLAQVEQLLSSRFDDLTEQYENSVSYEKYLPPQLRELVISR